MHIWRNICSIISLILLTATAYAGPARESLSTYTQPDGTTFSARFKGDEWFKLRTTHDGCAITKDAQGWWNYGVYDIEGNISPSGYKVGQPAPDAILAASRDIPHEVLRQNARKRRETMHEGSKGQIEAISRQAVMTKSGTEKVHNRGIALLVQFSDTKFSYKKDDFDYLLNRKSGSAKDYYEAQFGPGWEFTFDISDIITLQHPAKHYGENGKDDTDIRPWNMIKEACEAADSKIDFSHYDQDNDGEVDNVYVFYAGKSESENNEQTDLIWPHQYYIYLGEGIELFCDGKRIDRYACSAEITGTSSITGIGSFCHEYGHTLGLKDLYDTDYEDNGWAAGTWRSTSLMDGGNYNNNSDTPPNFNCIERETLKLSEPIILEEDHSYTLDPIHLNGTYCKLAGDSADEYYLFECRSNEGWDEYIGGKGMLVYHIDRSSDTPWEMNEININQSHQYADLIEADGRSDLITNWSDFTKNTKALFFPLDDVTAFTPTGTPQLKFWNGYTPDISITGIKMVGNAISFVVSHNSDIKTTPFATNISSVPFPEAAVIRFSSSDASLDGTPTLLWRKIGTEEEYATATPAEYAPGEYVCKLTGLESGNISYEVQIKFVSDNAIGKSLKHSFMTTRKPAVSWPYMYIKTPRVTPQDGVELHIVNAEQAARTDWYYNDVKIDTGADTRFFPTEDGILKAVISWKDGSTDTIVKELQVKL